ncbi:cytochrome c peroxidase mitochondrial precursor [Teratosphaeria nubilosa]|uniref:Peroxidase n=1 Tax=Teratosphaeria nubilosa TaxID=161662 RepID=A0A6G1LEF5_9PEZI|nr:cytochrome c peroxidase mitochondrial precursor [Teratosphaeria nubilosa]
MASVSRTFTRALRSTPASSALKTAPRRFAVQGPKISPRRGYSSEAPKSSGNNTYIYGGIAAAALLGGAYYAFGSSSSVSQELKSSSAAGAKNGLLQPTKEDYQKVYDAIAKRLIDEDDYDDGSYGPVLLRLGWHASGTYDKETGTGGSNGATMRFPPEGDHGANAGLKAARDFLEPVKEQFPWITYSDLWTLAAACAIQEMGGPDIPWRPGRQDRDVSYCTPDGRLPDGSKEQSHLRAIFNRMGFNDQEIVALSGAHALGRCHTDRSGFEGPWTFSPITLTNDYYKLLVEEKWNWRKWQGPKQYQDTKTKTLMMLPTDMALVKDKSFKQYVDKYAADQDAFFADFQKVLVKLFELGVPFTTGEDARMVLKRSE